VELIIVNYAPVAFIWMNNDNVILIQKKRLSRKESFRIFIVLVLNISLASFF